MILRPAKTSLLRPLVHTRKLHSSLPLPPIPQPTSFVPDAPTFLSLIGRKLSVHAPKIPTWDALFSLTSSQLRDLGVEPARSRRYLLWWREKYRRGEFGIGGELQEVVNGVGEVRVVERDGRKKVVNVQPGVESEEQLRTAKEVRCVKIRGAGTIVGSYFEPVKGSGGSVARIKVKEGLWEVVRGHKVHGGERRRKNTLSRIAARERGTLK